MKRILFVIGTRPEIIKTAPVIRGFKKDSRYRVGVCLTGQHKAMAEQMLESFELSIDYDLKLMKENQSLHYLASAALLKLQKVYRDFGADLVFVQGDTTTAFCAALCAYYEKIPLVHIEAGLRTFDKYQPFPEELNRTMISRIAQLHFAPTRQALRNLAQEHVSAASITVTGNTTIDALLYITHNKRSFSDPKLKCLPKDKRILLVTAHRRENFGVPLQNICRALRSIADTHKDILIVYPVHPNPNVVLPVKSALGRVENIWLIDPLEYSDFALLMSKAYLILTDSGGVQEEAPSLGVPVLILRNKTERPEVVRAGCAKIVGTRTLDIVRNCEILLASRKHYALMSKKKNPVGDGEASQRIKRTIDGYFRLQK